MRNAIRLFEPPEGQIRAAMRAVAIDQSVAALLVTKEDHFLAKQLDRSDRTLCRQLFCQRGRLPVEPHQFSAGVSGPVRVISSLRCALIMMR